MAFLNPEPAADRPRARRAAHRLARLLAALALCASARAETPAPALDEYQVKAAFLYNFAKFVEWPPQAFNSPSEPISICVVGDDPIGSALLEIVSSKDVAGRRLVVRQLSDMRQAPGCRILFVSSSEHRNLAPILAGAKGYPVLTVGETEIFSRQGGMINFMIEDGRVRFAINLEAAQRTGIHISSKLLSLAQAVKR